MKQTIFEVGDRVFDYRFGWGEVVNISELDKYPIFIRFRLHSIWYTKDGRLDEYAPKTLSFTEYTLEGFSQERPKELPEKGQVVWAKDNHWDYWIATHFVRKADSGNGYFCSIRSDLKDPIYYYQITTENPNK